MGRYQSVEAAKTLIENTWLFWPEESGDRYNPPLQSEKGAWIYSHTIAMCYHNQKSWKHVHKPQEAYENETNSIMLPLFIQNLHTRPCSQKCFSSSFAYLQGENKGSWDQKNTKGQVVWHTHNRKPLLLSTWTTPHNGKLITFQDTSVKDNFFTLECIVPHYIFHLERLGITREGPKDTWKFILGPAVYNVRTVKRWYICLSHINK